MTPQDKRERMQRLIEQSMERITSGEYRRKEAAALTRETQRRLNPPRDPGRCRDRAAKQDRGH